jgi:uncharacterized RDD family membrane protein YckC
MHGGALNGGSSNSRPMGPVYSEGGHQHKPPVHEEPYRPHERDHAPWTTRVAAFGIDLVVTLPGLIPLIIGYVIAFGDVAETGVISGKALFLFWFGAFVNLALWVYNNVILQGRTGQSLGKQDMRLLLVTVDGRPVGLGHTIARGAAGAAYVARDVIGES